MKRRNEIQKQTKRRMKPLKMMKDRDETQKQTIRHNEILDRQIKDRNKVQKRQSATLGKW